MEALIGLIILTMFCGDNKSRKSKSKYKYTKTVTGIKRKYKKTL